MNLRRKIAKQYVYVLALLLAVSMVGCHSSKNSQKTGTAVENVSGRDDKTSKASKHDATPTAVANALVQEARTWIGTPYKWGGHDHTGADCSGFLMEVYKAAVDVDIPRTTKDQRDQCLYVDKDNISIGDIIFFTSNNSGGKIAHVGMYVGDGRMIHASSSRGVVEDNLNLNYYVTHFQSIGRVPELAKANPVPKPQPAPEPKFEPVPEPKPAPMPQPQPKPQPKPQPQAKQAVTDSVKIDAASIVKNAFGKSQTQNTNDVESATN
jgi:lipoprotein Spr